MQNAQVNQANQLVIDAEKKLKSWWPFGGNKFEDALEMFQKAANLYKMTKNCIQNNCLIYCRQGSRRNFCKNDRVPFEVELQI